MNNWAALQLEGVKAVKPPSSDSPSPQSGTSLSQAAARLVDCARGRSLEEKAVPRWVEWHILEACFPLAEGGKPPQIRTAILKRVAFLRFRKDSLLCAAWVCFGPCFCRVPHGGFCLDQLVGLTGHVLLPWVAGKWMQRGAWLREQALHCGYTSVSVVLYALLEPRALYLEFCSGAIFAKLENFCILVFGINK